MKGDTTTFTLTRMAIIKKGKIRKRASVGRWREIGTLALSWDCNLGRPLWKALGRFRFNSEGGWVAQTVDMLRTTEPHIL